MLIFVSIRCDTVLIMFCASTTPQPTRRTHQNPTTPQPTPPTHKHTRPTHQHTCPTHTPSQHTHTQTPNQASTHTPNPSLHIKQNNCILHSHNNDLKIILYANFVHKHCHILDYMKVHMHKNMQKTKRNNMNEPTLQVEINCFFDN